LLEACASANPKDFQAFSALPSAARKANCPSRTGFILVASKSDPHPKSVADARKDKREVVTRSRTPTREGGGSWRYAVAATVGNRKCDKAAYDFSLNKIKLIRRSNSHTAALGLALVEKGNTKISSTSGRGDTS